jgi:hypothetical protein
MHLMRIGRSIVNLEYLIRCDESEDEPGALELHLEEGLVQHVVAELAEPVRRRLARLVRGFDQAYDGPGLSGGVNLLSPEDPASPGQSRRRRKGS